MQGITGAQVVADFRARAPEARDEGGKNSEVKLPEIKGAKPTHPADADQEIRKGILQNPGKHKGSSQGSGHGLSSASTPLKKIHGGQFSKARSESICNSNPVSRWSDHEMVIKTDDASSEAQILKSTNVGPFAGCSWAFLEQVLSHVNEKVYEKGEIIVEEEERDESLVALLDGTADIIVKERRVGVMSPGSVLGEATMQHFAKRLVSLRARTACRVLHVPASVIQKVLLDHSFGAERHLFVARKEARGEAAMRLKQLPCFAEIQMACLQAAVLEAEYVQLRREESWIPESSRFRDQGFLVVTNGHGSLQLEGHVAVRVTPGDLISEALLRSHQALLVADANGSCAFYRLTLHDLLAAILHFPEAEEWFNEFRERQNAKLQELKMGLASCRNRIAARAANPRDQDIQTWVAQRKAAKTKARGKKKEKKYGQIVKAVGGISLPVIDRTYGLKDDQIVYRVAVCSRA